MTRTPNIAERRLYHDLWYKRDWIYRRIDEIDVIKQDQFTIKSTFDLDIAYLREKLSIKEQDKSHRKQIALPLTPLLRFPILDIDVDLNGVPQSLAGSLTSASITRCILLQDIEDIFELNYDSRKWLSSILYQWLISGDVEVLKDANDELEVELRYCRKSANNEIPANLREVKNLGLKIKALNYLMSPLSDVGNKQNLLTSKYKLGDVFIAVVLLNLPENMQKAKLTFTITSSTNQDKKIKLGELVSPFFPARQLPKDYRIMETFLGRGIEERYHCRVNAPKGHYISKVEVVDSGNEKKRIPIKGTHDNLKQQSDLQQEIIDLRIRSFPENKTYIEIKDETQVGNGKYTETELVLHFEPFPYIFMIRAYISVVLLAIYLAMALFVNIKDIFAYAIGIAAVIFSFPNWFNANEDHDFVRATLKYPKIHFSILSFSCLVLGLIKGLERLETNCVLSVLIQ
jgi:hypothetical protein